MATVTYKSLSYPRPNVKDWVEYPIKPGATFMSYWRFNYRGEPVCIDTKPIQQESHLSMKDIDLIMQDFYEEMSCTESAMS